MKFKELFKQPNFVILLTIMVILLLLLLYVNAKMRKMGDKSEQKYALQLLDKTVLQSEQMFEKYENLCTEYAVLLQASKHDSVFLQQELQQQLQANPSVKANFYCWFGNLEIEEYHHQCYFVKSDAAISQVRFEDYISVSKQQFFKDYFSDKSHLLFKEEPMLSLQDNRMQVNIIAPIQDNGGVVKGFFGLKLDVSAIDAILCATMDYYRQDEHAFAFMLAQDGKVVSAVGTLTEKNQNLMENAMAVNDKDLSTLLYKMRNGENNSETVKSTLFHTTNQVFYKSLKHKDYSIIISYHTNQTINIWQRYFMILTLVIMLFIILIVIWFWWYDKKRKEMLGKICQAIDNISKGSTSSILPVSTIHGDLNEISLRIIMMQHGLDARNKEIISNTQDSERRSYERMLAQNIRKYFYTETYQSLSDTTSQNMELAVRYKYLADVGGDFHDLFNLSPESVCFVAGSVTRPKKDQNNIQTALDVLLTMNMIRMCVSQNKPLNTSIFELNNLLLKQNKGRFSVNLFVGIIECNTGKVDFICVGSCAIYLVSKQNIMSFGMKHGSALALVENETYAYGNRVLDFGDMLLIYTAGAISSQNTQNERFGLQRMSKTIAEISSINPEMFLKKISENIAEFSEMQSEQIDDYTLMAIKYTKQNHQ